MKVYDELLILVGYQGMNDMRGLEQQQDCPGGIM